MLEIILTFFLSCVRYFGRSINIKFSRGRKNDIDSGLVIFDKISIRGKLNM